MKSFALTRWMSAAACVAVWGCFQPDLESEAQARDEQLQMASSAARHLAAATLKFEVGDSLDFEEIADLLERSGVCPRFISLFRDLFQCSGNNPSCQNLPASVQALLACIGPEDPFGGNTDPTLQEIQAWAMGVLACFCSGNMTGGVFEASQSKPVGNSFNAGSSSVTGGSYDAGSSGFTGGL